MRFVNAECDVLIAGGGAGGCAAAMAVASQGRRAIIVEPTRWIGGQLTSQMVPPDEHPWIEEFGCTRLYRMYRNLVREKCMIRGLTGEALSRSHLNPGGGWVSRLCHEPAMGVEVLEQMMRLGRDRGLIEVWLESTISSINLDHRMAVVGDRQIRFGIVLDATETGDLLPMTGIDWVIGAESRTEFGEPHAIDGPAEPEAIQGITWCAALGWDEHGDHTIEKPSSYDFWRSYEPPYWTGPLFSETFPNVRTGDPQTLPLMGDFSWFTYRQIVDPAIWRDRIEEPVTCLNWPQNDLMTTPFPNDLSALEKSRELTLCLIYWMQTERGWRGLRLRPDVAGTKDGLAMAPYIRESRRIKGLATLTELDVAADCNEDRKKMAEIPDSVGIGAYRIDLHPRTNGRPTIDISALPFQIPIGCLVPRSGDLIAAAKNISVTHVANGCTRLHPVEWNIGETAGHLACLCLEKGLKPQHIQRNPDTVRQLQDKLCSEGIELSWPDEVHPL